MSAIPQNFNSTTRTLHEHIGTFLTCYELCAVIQTSKKCQDYYKSNLIWRLRLSESQLTQFNITFKSPSKLPPGYIHTQVCQIMNERIRSAVFILAALRTSCPVAETIPLSALMARKKEPQFEGMCVLTCADAILYDQPIAEDVLGALVVDCVKQEHHVTFKFLLARGSISIDKRSDAVMHAATGGHINMVSALLAHGPIIQDGLDMAVLMAIWRGHKEIVELLLAFGPISEKAREQLISEANQKDRHEIVEILKDRFLHHKSIQNWVIL